MKGDFFMAKILIADDAMFVRMNMKRMLMSSGHELIEADNGKHALEIYKEESPDLVIMDITMPEMDGISAVREIRKINPNAKVIMCSSMGQQVKIVDAIQAGATDFIVKPYKEGQVMDAINKALKEN
jgi:two-component system chemotaxis response regulator CheY